MKKILIVGFACLSLVAVAQTSKTGAAGSNNTKVSGPRDAASGQASGKQAPAGKSADRESSAPSVSEVVMKAPSGKGRESSQPSVSEAVAKAPSGGQGRVATGDLNGDGRPDLAATAGASSGKGQNTGTNKSRDQATGQASGKRQHAPVKIQKEVDATSPKL